MSVAVLIFGFYQQKNANKFPDDYNVFCIEGVSYVQFGRPGGASVMHNRDGTIKICGGEK